VVLVVVVMSGAAASAAAAAAAAAMAEDVIEGVIENVYDMMPSVPGFVLMARRMNKDRGVEDSAASTTQTMLAVVHMLCSVDIDLLMRKQLEHTGALLDEGESDEEEEEDCGCDHGAPGGEGGGGEAGAYMERQAALTSRELKEINDTDLKLRGAMDNTKKLLSELRQAREAVLAEYTDVLGQFQGMAGAVAAEGREGDIGAMAAFNRIVQNAVRDTVAEVSALPVPAAGACDGGDEEDGPPPAWFTEQTGRDPATGAFSFGLPERPPWFVDGEARLVHDAGAGASFAHEE
jgi:hypothetical protein